MHLWLALLSVAGAADEPAPDAVSAEDELVVEGARAQASASERTLDRADIETTPGRSADDLLRAMPGLLTAGLCAWGLGPRPLPGGFASHAAAVADLTSQSGPWSGGSCSWKWTMCWVRPGG